MSIFFRFLPIIMVFVLFILYSSHNPQICQLAPSACSSASFHLPHSQPFVASPTSKLILQPFCRFTYVTARSTTVPLLNLRHRHFTYVTAHSPTLPPFYLRHSSFYNRSTASHTSQALHLRHLASRPCLCDDV